MSFLNSIKNNSKEHNFPFNHWEYSDALSEEAIDEIVKALTISSIASSDKASLYSQ